MSEINFDKPFMPFDGMVEKLRSKHLTINNDIDEKLLRILLKDYGYSFIINGYKHPFTHKDVNGNEFFNDNVSVQDIYNMYFIDSTLSELLFKNTLHVENKLKATLGYIIAEKYGVDSNLDSDSSYLNSDNYTDNGKSSNVLGKIRSKISNPYSSSRLLKHYKTSKNHIPPWILVQSLTFGELIRYYKIQKGDVKTKVVNNFLPCKEQDVANTKALFISSLELLRCFRNSAAHSSPIYFFDPYTDEKNTSEKILPKKELIKFLGPNIFNNNFDPRIKNFGRKDLYGVMLVLILLLNTLQGRAFLRDLQNFNNTLQDEIFTNIEYLKYSHLPSEYIQRLENARKHLEENILWQIS